MRRGVLITENFTNLTSESFRMYLNDISQIDLFETNEDEADCATKAVNGDMKAKTELIMRNLRFVVSVAKKYESENAPILDLINQGNVGLIEAANRFNPTFGNKFISYAVWYIRKEIIEYLNNSSRAIRIPMNKSGNITKFKDEVNRLVQKEGKEVSIYEMYDNLDSFTNHEIDGMMELETLNVLSYDKQISHDGSEGGCLVELLESDIEPTDHLLLAKDKLNAMNKVLGTLKPMQELIIRAYYGIDGDEPMNLNEIGEQLNISRERVRQVKEKGLLKLKFLLNQIDYKDFTF
jgi:RNA polymerase primary sigma factor